MNTTRGGNSATSVRTLFYQSPRKVVISYCESRSNGTPCMVSKKLKSRGSAWRYVRKLAGRPKTELIPVKLSR